MPMLSLWVEPLILKHNAKCTEPSHTCTKYVTAQYPCVLTLTRYLTCDEQLILISSHLTLLIDNSWYTNFMQMYFISKEVIQKCTSTTCRKHVQFCNSQTICLFYHHRHFKDDEVLFKIPWKRKGLFISHSFFSNSLIIHVLLPNQSILFWSGGWV